MNVYAHYDYINEDRVKYRWCTLLQFGSSWNVIGSIVMQNPGSSSPLKNRVVDKDTLHHLHSFDNNDDWYMFSADKTMLLIEMLFRTYYNFRLCDSTLNGVIKVFNH